MEEKGPNAEQVQAKDGLTIFQDVCRQCIVINLGLFVFSDEIKFI